jgi:hypothetical protein
MDRTRVLGTRIFDFAIVADWDDRLAQLAGMAEPERWTYLALPDSSPLPILDNYVRRTFLRVHEQGKVAETDALACFNTGLLTPDQEELFGVFTRSDFYDPGAPMSRENKKWFLKRWARSGDRILTPFPSLPTLATYWTDPSDLVFNPALEVRPNIDHILRENLERFPVELGGQLDAQGVPLEGGPISENDALIGDEPPLLREEPLHSAPLAARLALDGAIKHSIRLAQRSYRIAVPQFYSGSIQLLLPLYMRDSRRADLALVLEGHLSWYRAATVLYTDWAYLNARLLTRPNSEWLGGFRVDAAT